MTAAEVRALIGMAMGVVGLVLVALELRDHRLPRPNGEAANGTRP